MDLWYIPPRLLWYQEIDRPAGNERYIVYVYM